MYSNYRQHRQYRKSFPRLLTLIILAVIALPSCGLLPNDGSSLKETHIALGIRETLFAGTATALVPAGNTVNLSVTMTPQPVLATDTLAPTAAPATNTPSPTETSTPTPIPSEIQLTNWQLSNMKVQEECNGTNKYPCWTGFGNNLTLISEQPIHIDQAWEKPYLVFSHDYLFEVEASIQVQDGSTWKMLWTYPAGAAHWNKVAINLEKHKGKDLIFRFFVGGQTLKIGGIWWKPDKEVESRNSWTLQNIEIIPNYTP